MTVTERERRRMELVDGSAHRTELCEQLAMREYELDNLKKENAKLREFIAESLLTIDQYMEKYGLTDLHEAVEHEKRRMRELGIEVGA